MKRNLIATLLVLFQIVSYAQEDVRGWSFGLNFGAYYPSKYTANYYNGDSLNENNAKYIFSNYFRYNEIYQSLNAHDTVIVQPFSENMHYKIALRPGLFVQYTLNPTYSLVMQFTYMALKVEDVLVVMVDPKEYLTEQDLRLLPLRGKERRVYADIGLRRNFVKTDDLSYYFIAGINMSSTMVQKSSFYVKDELGNDIEYDMRYTGNYNPYGGNQTFNPKYQGGVGFGIHGEVGASFRFGNSVVVEPNLTIHYLKVNLERYKSMRPGIGAGLRFLL